MAGKFERRSYRFAVFGTGCELTLLTGQSGEADRFACDAADWLRGFEQRYSRYLPASVVSQINQRAGREWTEVDAGLKQLLQLARQAWEQTDGAVDITALPLYELWHREGDALPTGPEIEEARARVGFEHILLQGDRVMLRHRGMGIDLGGIGKEYAIDCVAERERPASIRGLLVALGGDLRASGASPAGGWRVGVEAAQVADQRSAFLQLRQAAVATSGTGRRGRQHASGRIAHILDPRTGHPAAGPNSVTVFAPTCFEAGVQATAGCLQPDGPAALAWLRARGFRALVSPATRCPS